MPFKSKQKNATSTSLEELATELSGYEKTKSALRINPAGNASGRPIALTAFAVES